MSKFIRSPFVLRSKPIHKTIDTLQKSAIYSLQGKGKAKVSPNTVKCSVEKKNDITVFMDDLKGAMLNFQNKIEASISNLHIEFNNKYDQLKTEIEAIKVGMDRVEQRTPLESELAPYLKCHSLDQTVNYLITGSAVSQFKNNFMSQCELIQHKISEIERSNMLIEDMVCNMAASIESFMSSNERTNCVQLDQVACENIDDLKNDIDCLQHEIDRVKNASIADGEKVVVMNSQLHVLSAKFVDFNEKIHKYLIHSNNHEQNNVKYKDIIDPDTKPFIECNDTSKGAHNPNIQLKQQSNHNQRNQFSLRRKILHRFAVTYDPHLYSRFIRVVIHDAKIYNLDKFKIEFTEQFESFLGSNLVKSLNIVTYKKQEGVVKSIIITVALKVPLNYSYIDNFMLPANWCFFPWQITRKSKTKPEKERSETTSTKARNNNSKYM